MLEGPHSARRDAGSSADERTCESAFRLELAGAARGREEIDRHMFYFGLTSR